ncbi:hypothetical protein AB0E78_41560 [Streptomyces sp. NPDC032198]|uniref:hypothetical protein n=1 Tax=Streptomyces sp. NPDC032198 TaxID=3155127 RepID=UPI0033CAE11A
MSNTTPLPPEFPPPAATRPKKRNTNAVIIGAAAAVIAAVVGTGIVVVQSRDDGSKATATASSTTSKDPVTAAAEEVDEEPTYETPGVDDFTMTLRTTQRQCFGSAGCNVTVEPRLTYDGLSDLDPDAVYEITYEVSGDDSGPVIETAELSDETSLNYTPTSISMASAGKKVSVEITDVTEQGV